MTNLSELIQSGEIDSAFYFFKDSISVLQFLSKNDYFLIKSFSKLLSDEQLKEICIHIVALSSEFNLIDDLDEDVEFVVGVGVAAAKKKEDEVGMIGYTQIRNLDLFEDLLKGNKKYHANSILDSLIPNAGKHSSNIPVFKYLKEIGIESFDDYKRSSLNLDKWVLRQDKSYQCSTYLRSYVRKFKGKDAKYIIEHCTPESAAIYIPFLWDKIDLDVTRNFLIENMDKISPDNSSYATYFKELACLYDKLKYGWV